LDSSWLERPWDGTEVMMWTCPPVLVKEEEGDLMDFIRTWESLVDT
jgi:hypothetical protein